MEQAPVIIDHVAQGYMRRARPEFVLEHGEPRRIQVKKTRSQWSSDYEEMSTHEKNAFAEYEAIRLELVNCDAFCFSPGCDYHFELDVNLTRHLAHVKKRLIEDGYAYNDHWIRLPRVYTWESERPAQHVLTVLNPFSRRSGYANDTATSDSDDPARKCAYFLRTEFHVVREHPNNNAENYKKWCSESVAKVEALVDDDYQSRMRDDSMRPVKIFASNNEAILQLLDDPDVTFVRTDLSALYR